MPILYDSEILGQKHPFPPDVGPCGEVSSGDGLRRELGAVRASVEAVGESLSACRSVLLELQLQMTQLERQLTRLEAASSPAPGGSRSEPGPAPFVGRGTGSGDDTIDRVDRIREACEAMLKRPLRSSERPIVLRWAQLERGGEAVPVEEILHVAARLLTRRTAEGTLPGSLAWCDATVQTLARGAAGAVAPRGMDAAAEFAAMYEQLADRLDAGIDPADSLRSTR